MKKGIIASLQALIFVTVFSILAQAGNHNFYGGARQAGLSNSVIMSPRLGIIQNQAALGWIDSAGISIYNMFRPNLPELSVYGAHGSLPFLGGGLGLQIQRFGYDIYNENKIGLGYGKQLGEHFSAGVQLNYMYTHLSGPYESYHNVVAEAGVQAQFGDRWLFGVHIFNPTLSKAGDKDEEIPETMLRAGAGVKVTDEFLILGEAEKHIDRPINFRLGIDYQFDFGLNFQAGFQTEPSQFSAGAGYIFNQFAVQVAVTSSKYLEPGTHFSLIYHF
jgi:hypothetical protein